MKMPLYQIVLTKTKKRKKAVCGYSRCRDCADEWEKSTERARIREARAKNVCLMLFRCIWPLLTFRCFDLEWLDVAQTQQQTQQTISSSTLSLAERSRFALSLPLCSFHVCIILLYINFSCYCFLEWQQQHWQQQQQQQFPTTDSRPNASAA